MSYNLRGIGSDGRRVLSPRDVVDRVGEILSLRYARSPKAAAPGSHASAQELLYKLTGLRTTHGSRLCADGSALHIPDGFVNDLQQFSEEICREGEEDCGSCPLISFCKVGREKVSASSSDQPVAVELFAGSGGLSLGFSQEGFAVHAAVELDRAAAQTYRFNHPGVPVLEADMAVLDVETLNRYSMRMDNVDVLIAGPPCQGYSAAGRRDPTDPTNLLFKSVTKFARALRPKVVVLENVPGVRMVNGVGFSDRIRNSLRSAGYSVPEPETVRACDYGVPQKRRRLVYLGVRSDIRIVPTPLVPTHRAHDVSHGDPNIDLLPPTPRLEEVLEGLPELEPGCIMEVGEYEGLRLFNASTMAHSAEVVAKIAGIQSGKGPISYRRLERDAARTLVAGHRALPVHPWLNRTISVREAARIQSFPDDYVFAGTRALQPLQVANAVPPPLARAVARSVRGVVVEPN